MRYARKHDLRAIFQAERSALAVGCEGLQRVVHRIIVEADKMDDIAVLEVLDHIRDAPRRQRR